MATNVDYSSRDTAVVFAGLDDRESYSIKGGTGNDTLGGNAGSDTIQGGKGADIITGGAGADVFVYQSGDGKDIITDYEQGLDQIVVLGTDSRTKVESPIVDAAGDVTFAVGSGQIVVAGASDKYVEILDGSGNRIMSLPIPNPRRF